MSFAQVVIPFLRSLELNVKLPRHVEVLNPYRDAYVVGLCEQFYTKYYDDTAPRTLMLGINPGRFGSGTTGISFTDPVLLEKECGIANTLARKGELSADFIYRMIRAYGGPGIFYSRFFISAVSPLGFVKDGKNINYYDDKKLEKSITPFVIASIESMLQFPVNRETCFCIGEGKNIAFLNAMNEKHQWFTRIVPLAHPRFIMQYKRKQLNSYIDDYLRKLADS